MRSNKSIGKCCSNNRTTASEPPSGATQAVIPDDSDKNRQCSAPLDHNQQTKQHQRQRSTATAAAAIAWQRINCLHSKVRRHILQWLAADAAAIAAEKSQCCQQQHSIRTSITVAAVTAANFCDTPNRTKIQSQTAGTSTPKSCSKPTNIRNESIKLHIFLGREQLWTSLENDLNSNLRVCERRVSAEAIANTTNDEQRHVCKM